MAQSIQRISQSTHVSDSIDAFLREIEAPSFTSEIYRHVHEAFCAARSHRQTSGVEREMLQSLRAYKAQYDPEDLELLENPHEVYMGITNLKCRALQSWLYDILLPAEDQPWTLAATPVPDLPSRLEEIIVNRLTMEFEAGGLEAEDFEDLAAEAKTLGMEAAQDIAKDATMGMEKTIRDQLEEGGWRDQFDQFIVDLSIYPNAVLRGPVMRNSERLGWKDGAVERLRKTHLQVERVSPWDVYPSANSKSPQDGSYVCLVSPMSQTGLHDCIGLYGFDEIAIRRVIADNPHGTHDWLNRSDSVIDALERKDHNATSPDQTYQVIVYYGKIPGRLLLDHNISVEDPHGTVEAEVWICQGHVLRAITNPYPLGKRPIYTATVQKEPGSFWGRSLPSILRDVQRVANASARALVKNMGFSAGPIGEYDKDRLDVEEDITDMRPFRMFAVDQDPYNGQGNAVRFYSVENVTNRLLAVYDRFGQEADDVSGIPAYALGQPQTAGAGRTLGGLSLLLGNAAKGVKRIVANVDHGTIEPMVGMYYMLNLLYGEDESIKADAQVMARGSSGLLQRELSQARAVEVLQIITPYVSLGIVPPESVLLVLRDVVASLGYPPDAMQLDDPARLERLQIALAQTAQQGQPQLQIPGAVPQQLGAAAPGTPIPTLDGRSAVPPDPSSLEALTGSPL